MGGGKRLSHEEEVKLGIVKEELVIILSPIILNEPMETVKLVVLDKPKIKKTVNKVKKILKRRK